MDLLLQLFSRAPLDDQAARQALAFVTQSGDGALRPEECGVYEPFEPFRADALERYVAWLTSPGGEFGFRRAATPFPLQGRLSNLLMPETATAPPPAFCTRWRVRLDSTAVGSRGPEFLKQLLIDACQRARADYAAIATDRDYRMKHFTSVRDGVSDVQQYVGDDPGQGIPGLYWMNVFGPLYVDYFGRDKLTAVADLANVTFLDDGAVFVRFGRRPEESESAATLELQRAVIRTLGDAAFFDLRHPHRTLTVPAVLR
jgi:hypothetical protein